MKQAPSEGVRKRLRVGLAGAGIQHSSSPAMHVEEGEALGLNVSYELFDFDLMEGGAARLEDVLDKADSQGFAGLNITYPSKQAVIPLLDELAPEARALTAVNTVLFRQGKRIGHNTDWWGFAESFKRDMADASIEDVVLVGAGGAGAAVGYAMLKLGTRALTIHDTDQSRAVALATRLGELFPDRRVRLCEQLATSLANTNGLVHATPTGMRRYPGLPVPSECLRPPLWVAEIVYVPLLTELLATARRQGCRTLDGGGMAVFQAAMAFKLFFDVEPDIARMRHRFHTRLATAAA
ncbi:MAG TPA: shikimate dehydrogenase [Steroidobacteraceae bacterium]|nr:shikimate dehydrogenase [Steroidobacteraceae bacterium]